MMRLLSSVAALAALPAVALAEMPDIRLEFRGEVTLPQDLTVDGQTFGGISGLTRDPQSGH